MKTKNHIKKISEICHGAGIDAIWYIEEKENGSFICSNSFHVMNDAGFYIFWIDFELLVNKNGECEKIEFLTDINSDKYDFDLKNLKDEIVDRWNCVANNLEIIKNENTKQKRS